MTNPPDMRSRSPLRDMDFVEDLSCLFVLSVWHALVAAGICSESCVRVSFANGVGTGMVPVFLLCAGLS